MVTPSVRLQTSGLGGGSPRVVRLARREGAADSPVASLAGDLGSHALADLAADRADRKLAWVKENAARAGRVSAT